MQRIGQTESSADRGEMRKKTWRQSTLEAANQHPKR